MSVREKLGHAIILLATAFALFAAPITASAAIVPHERIWGNDRYQTATNVAQAGVLEESGVRTFS